MAAFKTLVDALKSGDIGAAQNGYAELKGLVPAGQLADPSSPLARLGAALESADVNGAKAALALMLKGSSHHLHRVSGSASSGAEQGSNAADPGDIGRMNDHDSDDQVGAAGAAMSNSVGGMSGSKLSVTA